MYAETFHTQAPRLRLLVMQPTPFCNLDCSYCYLPNRSAAVRMGLDTVELVCRRVFESPLLGNELEVAWHAGEPLVVPLTWYDEAVQRMAELRPAGLQLTHRFQTNGVLLNGAWASFLSRIGAKVGLSIDGPRELHDTHRRTRSGSGTHTAAMQAVRVLQDHRVAFSVITVLTREALDHPERLFDFYVGNGIEQVGFNVEEIEGLRARSSLADPGITERFRRFVRTFLRLVWASPGLLRVREFEETCSLLLSGGHAADEQNLPFAIISVAYDGSVSTFSPELLGARHPRFPSFAFGQVGVAPLADMADQPLFRRVQREIRRGVAACARDCHYYRWCGGGAPANKLFETGRFDATETMHCRLSRRIVLDELLAELESHTGEGAAARDPIAA